LTCLQLIEELVGVTICDRDLLDVTVDTIHNAHLVVHSAYGFDVSFQTLDEGMTSLVLHFSFFGSSTWAHDFLYHLYDPSSMDVIFDGVSIYGLLRSFPLHLFEDCFVNDFQPIMLDLSLLPFDVPPLIDVPSLKTS
jgi:hypothetical protein